MVQTIESNRAVNDVLPGDEQAVNRVEALFRQYADTGDAAVREQIIVSYLGLADRLAERYRGSRGARPGPSGAGPRGWLRGCPGSARPAGRPGRGRRR